MSSAKTDRRVKYTKMVLKQTLIRLLEEKPITKISIKEICEAADVNRSTFYTHYRDQYDLLKQLEQEVLSEINDYLAGYNFKAYEPESFQLMNRIFEYVVANAPLCRVLLGENGDLSLQREIMMIIQRQSMKELQGKMTLDPEMAEYLFLFAINGGIGMVQKWLQSGMKKNAREMAELMTKLMYQGISSLL